MTLHGIAGQRHVVFRQAGQAFRSQQAHVDQGAQGAESLVGADVGCGLGAADVLLSGLEGQHVAGFAVQIRGAARDAAGELADVLFAAGHDAQIGTAEGQRLAQALGLGHGHVGPHFAGV